MAQWRPNRVERIIEGFAYASAGLGYLGMYVGGFLVFLVASGFEPDSPAEWLCALGAWLFLTARAWRERASARRREPSAEGAPTGAPTPR
jgi:hypothetical protein